MCEAFRSFLISTKADAPPPASASSPPAKPKQSKPKRPKLTGPRYIFQPDGSVLDRRRTVEPLLKPRVLSRDERRTVVGRINATREGSAPRPGKLPRMRRDRASIDSLAAGAAMQEAALRRRGIRPKPRNTAKVRGSQMVYGPQDAPQTDR